MTDLQQAARTLDGRIGPVLGSTRRSSDAANRTLKSAEAAIAGTDAMLQAAQRALAQADRTLKTADSVIQPEDRPTTN